MDPSGLQYPPPTDHPAFERLTRRIFAKRLSMPQLVGRSGQEQHGADIAAHGVDGFVVIQCKLKDELALDPDLRLREFREEARAAREKFKPSLRWYILATTAPNDAKLQECARQLTQEFRADGIDVQFYGWNEMRVAIGEDLELREDYLGESGISKLSTKIDDKHDALNAKMDEMLRRMPSVTLSASPHLKRALERTKVKIDGGQVRAALGDLDALREDEWADATPENRFVILTQLGSARWALGEQDAAAALFVEASALQPDHKIGLANLAASLAISGDPAGALRAASRLLEITPASDEGILALVQAQEQIDPAPHPLDPVPEALRETEEAYLGAIQVFRNRGDGRWVAMAAEGAAAHPDSELLQRMQADAVLHRLATENGVHAGARSTTAPPWDEVVAACATLEKEWRKHISQDPTKPDKALGQNLAQLLRALDRFDDALPVLDRLGADDEPGANLTTLRGMLLAATGRGAEALVVLAERLDAPANRILSGHIQTDPAERRRVLAGGDWSAASQDEQMWRAILDLEARAELEPGFDPAPGLAEVAAEHPDRLIPHLSAGRACGRDAADESAAAIVRIVGHDTPFSDLLQAATWLRDTDRLKEVVALLGGRVSSKVDSPGLHLLVFALLNLGERAVLNALLDQVPEPLASTARFVEYRAYSAFNSGEMGAARRHVEAFLELEPLNLRARLLWVQVLVRQQDEESIAEWLRGPVEELDGRLEDRAQVSHLLASRCEFERAQRSAYRLARANPDSKVAQERFLAVVLLNPMAPATPVVALGTVFTLVDEKGGKTRHRIEADADLPMEIMDLRPASPLAAAAMGRAKGDEVRLRAQLRTAPDRVFTIDEVVHVHAFYFNHMADVMPTRFEGPVMLHKFTVDPDTGDGLETILDVVTSNGTDAARAVEQYHATAAPIRLLALAVQSDVIACYDSLTRAPDGTFAAEDGQDLTAPGVILRNRVRGCLVDTLTAELIRRHQLLDVVTATMGPLSVSQSTVDDFIGRCEHDRQLGLLQPHGRLGAVDGRPVHFEEHAARREMTVADRKSALAWLRSNARIVPAVGPPGLAGRLRERIPSEMQDALVDDMLAAAQPGLPILSDDLGYRRTSRGLAGVEAVGLTSVLLAALDAGTIYRTEYVAKLSSLAKARHVALPISALDIIEALNLDGSEPGNATRGLVAQLGGPDADMRSHLAVAVAALDAIWADDGRRRNRLQLILLVADRLLRTSPEARARFGAALLRDPDEGVALLARYVTALDPRMRSTSNAA